MDDPRSDLEATLFETLSALEEARTPFALIGGLAVSAHTEGRATKDVDIVLACPNSSVPGLVEALGRHGFEVEPERHIRELTRDGITVFRRPRGRLDVMKPPLPFFQRLVDCAADSEFLGKPARVATPEYLIVLKVLAGRDRDKADIAELLSDNPRLDRALVLRELSGFLRETDPRWLGLKAQLDALPSA